MLLEQRPGMSVIEVLVALGLAGIIIFSVGNLVAATNRLNAVSTAQGRASLVAQGQLEQLVSFADDPATAGAVFLVSNDGGNKFTLDTSTTPWTLQDVTANPPATWFTITAQASPADKNVQTVLSHTEWMAGTLIRPEEITTVFTDWKNLVP